jgi:hypothetical protein
MGDQPSFNGARPVASVLESLTVAGTYSGVAAALRLIADEIERHELTLIGLWSTGFGNETEAVIQVVFEADGHPLMKATEASDAG